MIKNFIVEFVLIICSGLCTIFFNLIKDVEHIEFIFLIPILSMLYLIWYKKKFKYCEDLEKFKCKSLDTKRYSIVLIDDDYKLRTRYHVLFSSMYEIHVIDKIDCAFYVYGFDIIIFDVVKTVTFNKESCLDLIKRLKDIKPYKYVIAISSDKDKLDECKPWSDAVILKDDNFQKKLKEQVDNAFKILDVPKDYWDRVLKSEYLRKEKESFYKSDYINTIMHNPHFTNE